MAEMDGSASHNLARTPLILRILAYQVQCSENGVWRYAQVKAIV